MSKTQLSNFMTGGMVLAFILSQFGIIFPAEKGAYILYGMWTLGWTAYNFFQRYKKGDLTLGGLRK